MLLIMIYVENRNIKEKHCSHSTQYHHLLIWFNIEILKVKDTQTK